MVSQVEAKRILTSAGWLSLQPETFQTEVLRRAHLICFAAGDVVYRLGDPLGGVYGLVAGAVAVSTSPPAAMPRLFHVGMPGSWIGEGPFLSRQPRRVGMQAAVETWMLYLPLAEMDEMEREDPSVVRRFAQILLMNLDILVRAFDALQHPNDTRRVALALLRVVPQEGKALPLSQSDLGTIAHASRKQVNAALGKFADAGWLTKGYRSVTLCDMAALGRFADGGDE